MKNLTMTNVTQESTHTTAKELDFIEHLGEQSENRRHKLSRKQLLLAYIEATRLRSRWGDIKPHMVLDRAYELIAEDHEARSLIGAGVLTNGDARTFPLQVVRAGSARRGDPFGSANRVFSVAAAQLQGRFGDPRCGPYVGPAANTQ